MTIRNQHIVKTITFLTFVYSRSWSELRDLLMLYQKVLGELVSHPADVIVAYI